MNTTVACKAVRRPACLAQAKRRPAPAPARPMCPKLGARAVRCQAHEHEHPALSSQEVVHRAERLVELAHEFMHQWIKATREGPTEQVISSLNTIVDNKLLFRTSHLLGGFEAVGLDGLRDKLTLDKHRAGAVRPKKVVMCAANDESDSVFCLLECDEVPPEGTPAPVEGVKHGAESIKHGAETVIEKASQGMEKAKGMVTGTEPSMKTEPSTKQEPSIQHEDRRMYGIVKFDTLLDDTKRIITGVTERCQLGRGETSLLSVHLPATTEGQMPKERMQEEMEVMLKAAGITHFPSERIKELTMQGPTIDMTAAKANVEKWCRARSSGEDERALLDEALESEKPVTISPTGTRERLHARDMVTEASSFRLWDAYGVLPLVCGLKAKGADISSPNKCLMDKETVMEIIREAKASHDISVSLLDSAICSRHNVGFSHWRSHISPKGQEGQQGGQQGSKQDICIEGLEMLVFNGDGRIMDIWMMRDPMPEERKMLEETAKKAGVKF